MGELLFQLLRVFRPGIAHERYAGLLERFQHLAVALLERDRVGQERVELGLVSKPLARLLAQGSEHLFGGRIECVQGVVAWRMRPAEFLNAQRRLAFDGVDEPREAADVVQVAVRHDEQVDPDRLRGPEDAVQLVRDRRRRTVLREVARVRSVHQDARVALDREDAVAVDLVADVEQVDLHGVPHRLVARRFRCTALAPHAVAAGAFSPSASGSGLIRHAQGCDPGQAGSLVNQERGAASVRATFAARLPMRDDTECDR